MFVAQLCDDWRWRVRDLAWPPRVVLPLLIFAGVAYTQCAGCPEEELDGGCESLEPCGDCFVLSLTAEDAPNDAGFSLGLAMSGESIETDSSDLLTRSR